MRVHVIRGKQPPWRALPLSRMKTSPSCAERLAAQRRQEEENMANYTLPDLPYDFAALEPHISGKIMELHHDKHHQAYVDRREHRARAARRGPRQRQPRERQQAREGPRVQPRRSRQPLDLLDEPVARTAAASPRASSQAAIDEFFGSLRQVPGALHRRGHRHPGLRLGGAELGLDRRAADHPAAVRPAGQHRRRARSRCSCSTCGSTRSTSTT